jgi:hypothetical protein
MRVFGTPLNPNPPTSTVVSDFMSLRASCAEGYILLISDLREVEEKKRVARPPRRAVKRNVRCIVKKESPNWYRSKDKRRRTAGSRAPKHSGIDQNSASWGW